MTASPCSCDDSKSWQLRALAAEAKNRALELALKFARQQLERLLDKVSLSIAQEDDPSEERIPGTWGETVIASGTQAATTANPLTEVHCSDGVIGFCGGTEEERQAAIEAAGKGER